MVELNQTIANKYRLDKFVGQGAWAKIYRATDISQNKSVAIKLLSEPDNSARKEKEIERFFNEARTIATLHHPNIVDVFDYGLVDGEQAYFVMEYVAGSSLATILDNGPLPLTRALSICVQICSALIAAHEKGILHRDIKPDNVVVSTDATECDTVKLLDFGMLKIIQSDMPVDSLTTTGVTVGTPGYMSPEQCLGKQLSPASDIYSLGCLMYEALTGRTPFRGANPIEVLEKHMKLPPDKFDVVCPQREWPPGLEQVVLKTLEKDPRQRYQSAAPLKADLERVIAGKPPNFGGLGAAIAAAAQKLFHGRCANKRHS
ncbi:MAG TPA: serine/threonine-protein kinase [Candidatus Obscuribacterales bacterium]